MDSLVADYGSGSDTSDNEDSSDSSLTDTIHTVKKLVESQAKKPTLPPPAFDDNSASIFTNPYIEAENAKSAILEKHVKMIPSKEFITEINGKKICWMYRKGRCRFGSNCKYAHDTELHNQDQSKSSDNPDTGQPTTPSDEPTHSGFPPDGYPPTNLSGRFPPNPTGFPSVNRGFPSLNQSGGFPPSNQGSFPPSNQGGFPPSSPEGFPPSNKGGFSSSNRIGFPPSNPGGFPPSKQGGFPPFQPNLRNFPDDNEDESSQKRKKRPGLSQDLVPGKKVMKMYYSSSK